MVVGKAAIGNMLGGIGYFYGQSKVSLPKNTKVSELYLFCVFINSDAWISELMNLSFHNNLTDFIHYNILQIYVTNLSQIEQVLGCNQLLMF